MAQGLSSLNSKHTCNMKVETQRGTLIQIDVVFGTRELYDLCN